MFNEICWRLNTIGLSKVAALLRRIVTAVTSTKLGEYTNADGRVRANNGLSYTAESADCVTGYKGWIESPFGVVAFVRDDNTLQWEW